MAHFDPYRLHLGEERLWRGDEEVHLTAKAFAVLRHLVMHAGQLVTRDALFDAIWGTPYVTEAALAACIREIRRALDDRAHQPQFIETIRGRGLRFVAPVQVESEPSGWTARSQLLPVGEQDWTSELIVARAVERGQLASLLSQTVDGARQTVFVTGEAGIGKTTLIHDFVRHFKSHPDIWLGYGQCIDQYGEGEPYLPLLDALSQLLRRSDGHVLLDLMKQHAPSWLLQCPAFVTEEEVEPLQRRSGTMTRERMLRELAEVVEALTHQHPLVLILEDLHWSDVSTLEWVTYISRRTRPARLLIIATFRPVDALVADHPVRQLTHELVVRGLATEIILEYFSESDVKTYLQHRFGPQFEWDAMAPMIYQRTNGNPLFLVAMAQELEQVEPTEDHNAWTQRLREMASHVPDGLRQLIKYQCERLPSKVQRLLNVASVAGREFAVAAIADSLDCPIDDVEADCAELASRGQLIRECGVDDWPDGTITTRFSFIHDLYREALYQLLTSGQRVRYHGHIAARLEAGYGDRVREIAAELAEHFTRGHRDAAALTYLQVAGENALERRAYQEASAHIGRALDVLANLPETSEHQQTELRLRMTLGPILMMLEGWSAPDVKRTYARAQHLCELVGSFDQKFPILYGLWAFEHNLPDYSKADRLASALLDVAQLSKHSAWHLEAHLAQGVNSFHMGRLETAQQHLESGIDLYDAQEHEPWATITGQDPGVVCLTFLSWTLALQGNLDQARKRSQEAVDLAQTLDHLFSQEWALIWAAALSQFLREQSVAYDYITEVISGNPAQEFALLQARKRMLSGWKQFDEGEVQLGIDETQRGLVAHKQTNTQAALSYWLGLLAHMYAKIGRRQESLTFINEALDIASTTSECFFEAELYRRKAMQHTGQSACDNAEIESLLCQSLHIARQQNAKLLELRAAISLAQLWRCQPSRYHEAYLLLDAIYNSFTEGLATADLQEAKNLLHELQASRDTST